MLFCLFGGLITFSFSLFGSVYVIDFVVVGLAVLVFLVGFVVKKGFLDPLIGRAVKGRGGRVHDVHVAQKVVSYIFYPILLVVVLGVLGVDLTALGALVGLLGLGFAFALKDLIANFVSGLFILITRPFKIGDQIESNGEKGVIEDIRVRATEIKTYDGRKVILPNSVLYNDKVINDTAYKVRRFEVLVGIGYEEDIRRAKELALEVLRESELIQSKPEPQVATAELGGSSVNLKLKGWTDSQTSSVAKAMSEITQKIKERYDEANINIPYPIRTVYMEEE